jgi:hypothetical protein
VIVFGEQRDFHTIHGRVLAEYCVTVTAQPSGNGFDAGFPG